MKVWLGLLAEEAEHLFEFGRLDAADHSFGLGTAGEPLAPLAKALREVACERFSYQTAESEVGGQPSTSRLDQMESAIKSIQESLSLLGTQGDQRPKGRKPALIGDLG